MNLLKKFRKFEHIDSLMISISQLIKAIIQILLTIFLARILSPEIFGYFVFAVGVLVIFETFRDFGFTSLAIQSDSNDQSTFDNNFWVTFTRGLIMTSAMYILLFIFSFIFYINKMLFDNILILSLVPLVSGLSNSYNILLWKTYPGRYIAAIDGIAFCTSFISIPFMSMLDKLELAMAMQLLFYQLILMLIRIAVVRIKPNIGFKFSSLKKLYEGSLNLGFFALLRVVSNNIDTLLIGTLLGANALGLYNRAFQISQVPIQLGLDSQTNYVIARSSNEKQFRKINTTFRYSSLPIFAFLTFISLNSQEFLIFLYGNIWGDAAVFLSVLCIVGILRCFEFKILWFLLATKNHKLILMRNIEQTILVITGTIIGTNFGALGVAIGILIALVINLLITRIKFLRSGIGLNELFFRRDIWGLLLVFITQFIPFLILDSFQTRFAIMICSVLVITQIPLFHSKLNRFTHSKFYSFIRFGKLP